MKKIIKIYSTSGLLPAFRDMEKAKAEGYTGTLSFVRGRRDSSDIKIKIVYVKPVRTKCVGCKKKISRGAERCRKCEGLRRRKK